MRFNALFVLACAAFIKIGLPEAKAQDTVFNDPRGRYSLSYNQDWKVMLNFAGMPSFFCNWEGCDKSSVSGCTFFAVGTDLGEKIPEADYEMLLLNAAYAAITEPSNAAVNGKATTAIEAKTIGFQKWGTADVAGSLIGVKTEGSMWVTLNHKVLISIVCKAIPAKWPEYKTKVLRVIETVRLND
jgi:hypothetical protein